uniref:Multidrug and toxin extrusion protein n=1 Tax=Macrostomum lignano TaxID=282301 RepID=A0A1I8FD65_9PLAT
SPPRVARYWRLHRTNDESAECVDEASVVKHQLTLFPSAEQAASQPCRIDRILRYRRHSNAEGDDSTATKGDGNDSSGEDGAAAAATATVHGGTRQRRLSSASCWSKFDSVRALSLRGYAGESESSSAATAEQQQILVTKELGAVLCTGLLFRPCSAPCDTKCFADRTTEAATASAMGLYLQRKLPLLKLNLAHAAAGLFAPEYPAAAAADRPGPEIRPPAAIATCSMPSAQYVAIHVAGAFKLPSKRLHGHDVLHHLAYILWTRMYRGDLDGWKLESLYDWGDFIKLSVPGIFLIALRGVELRGGHHRCRHAWCRATGAPQSIVFQLESISYMIPFGMSVAVNIRVGQQLGANQPVGAARSYRAVSCGAIRGTGRASGRRRAAVHRLLRVIGLPIGIPLALLTDLQMTGIWLGLLGGHRCEARRLLLPCAELQLARWSEPTAETGARRLWQERRRRRILGVQSDSDEEEPAVGDGDGKNGGLPEDDAEGSPLISETESEFAPLLGAAAASRLRASIATALSGQRRQQRSRWWRRRRSGKICHRRLRRCHYGSRRRCRRFSGSLLYTGRFYGSSRVLLTGRLNRGRRRRGG